MTTVSKNIHITLTRDQLLARAFVTPRGRQIGALFVKEPRISVREQTELSAELNTILTEIGDADLEAALERGDFYRQPGAREWPGAVFKGDNVFGRIMSAALELKGEK